MHENQFLKGHPCTNGTISMNLQVVSKILTKLNVFLPLSLVPVFDNQFQQHNFTASSKRIDQLVTDGYITSCLVKLSKSEPVK